MSYAPHPTPGESFGAVHITYAPAAPEPSEEDAHDALEEMTRLLMAERTDSKEAAVLDHFRETFKPPAGEWKSKRWIVILSDDERVRSQVSAILEGENFYVRTAETIEELLDLLDAAYYLEDGKIANLAMIDMFLAKMRGLTFFKELRQRTAYAKIPVVMLVRGNEMPAVPFIFSVSEPIDRVGLLEFVHREASPHA